MLSSSVNNVGGCLEPAVNDLNTSLIPSPVSRRDGGVTEHAESGFFFTKRGYNLQLGVKVSLNFK